MAHAACAAAPPLPARSSACAPAATLLSPPLRSVPLDAALAHVLSPPVDLLALSGVIHTCALWAGDGEGDGDGDGGGDDVLRNIAIGEDAPRSLFDWLVVCAVRARASAVVASGASLRAEGGGATPLFGEPFAEGARGLRARAGLEARGAVCVLSRGEAPLEPAWPIFTGAALAAGGGSSAGAGAAGEGAGSGVAPAAAPSFSPVVVLPSAAARERVLARFAPSASPTVCAVDGLTPRGLVSLVRAAMLRDEEAGAAGAGAASAQAFPQQQLSLSLPPPLALPLPRRASPSGPRHLAFIECGPSVTRDFYSTGGDAADPGAPRTPGDVPVDWLLLSTFRGPLRPAARGAPLVRRSTVARLFERVASGAARGDSNPAGDAGVWAFELWRRRE
jgi:hypothetical protein